MKNIPNSPLTEAREAVGLTLHAAAQSVGIRPDYLRRIERRGQAPYVLAQKLARRYRCSALLFAQRLGAGSLKKGEAAKKQTGRQTGAVGSKRQRSPRPTTISLAQPEEGF
jgi:hypothetical protein